MLIKRDLTRQRPSLSPARSHLAALPGDVSGGNEEASAEPIRESIIELSSPLLRRLMLLNGLISLNFNE